MLHGRDSCTLKLWTFKGTISKGKKVSLSEHQVRNSDINVVLAVTADGGNFAAYDNFQSQNKSYYKRLGGSNRICGRDTGKGMDG